MSVTIEFIVEVDADVDAVWQVITDQDVYAEWNPFVVASSSTLAVGDPIRMRVRVLPFFAQPQTETIFKHEPGRLLSYGMRGDALGALRSYRSHRLIPAGSGVTRYESRFELSGWLAPLVGLLFYGRLYKGFKGMTRGIKRRAEYLAGP